MWPSKIVYNSIFEAVLLDLKLKILTPAIIKIFALLKERIFSILSLDHELDLNMDSTSLKLLGTC